MSEPEWLTRKKRIDIRLRSMTPPWKIIRYHDGLDLSALHYVAVEEFPTENGPADYALFVNGILIGIIEAKKVTVNPQNVLEQGAGQYFTPRPLIQTICKVMKPDPRGNPDFRLCDPACGTGGFLVCAWEWLISKPVSGGVFDRADYFIRKKVYHGQDFVPRPRRLALMNLFLHGVEPHIALGDTIYEPDRGDRFDCVLTNPPFGTKGANQAPDRDDFTIETSNKQLNFVQHVLTILKTKDAPRWCCRICEIKQN